MRTIAALLLALVPIVAHAKQPADPVTCLAMNLYYEAVNEPLAGQVAVAQVVLNRVADPRYPDTICGVVYQQLIRSDGVKVAAFSWTLGRAWRAPGPVDRSKYARCVWIAREVIAGVLKAPFGKQVEFYHASYIRVGWHRHLVVRIGHHEFFR